MNISRVDRIWLQLNRDRFEFLIDTGEMCLSYNIGKL